MSQDSVSLGDVSVCSQSSRILFLTNMSQTEIVHYAWDLPQQRSQVVGPEKVLYMKAMHKISCFYKLEETRCNMLMTFECVVVSGGADHSTARQSVSRRVCTLCPHLHFY